MAPPFIHPTAVIDGAPAIGDDTKIWHFAHISAGATIGARCAIGHACYIGEVAIGDGCRIQNFVSLYAGVTLEADVFLGPSCVFTNVTHPRAHVSRKDEFAPTRVRRGATIGANATIVCGVTIGEHAMIGAGAVVTRDVPAYALVVGTPARRVGWACECGETVSQGPTAPEQLVCEACSAAMR